jgi:hypothetical protein
MFDFAFASATASGKVTELHARIKQYDALRRVVAGFMWGIIASFLMHGGKDTGYVLVGEIDRYAVTRPERRGGDGSCVLASDDQNWYHRPFSATDPAGDVRRHAVLMCVYYSFTVYLTSVRGAMKLFGSPLDIGAGVKVWDLFNLQQALSFATEPIPRELHIAASELLDMVGGGGIKN